MQRQSKRFRDDRKPLLLAALLLVGCVSPEPAVEDDVLESQYLEVANSTMSLVTLTVSAQGANETVHEIVVTVPANHTDRFGPFDLPTGTYRATIVTSDDRETEWPWHVTEEYSRLYILIRDDMISAGQVVGDSDFS